MAKKKKEEGKKGLDEWMATYSDMVTLLMCFFVMLYASSTPDETKWQYIFQAFTSQGKYVNPFVDEMDEEEVSASDDEGNSSEPSNAGEGTQYSDDEGLGLPQSFDEFSAWFENTAANSEYAASISVEQTSSSRIHIRFNNAIMFEGDSAVLLDSGREALSLMLPGIRAISDYIKRIDVSGHTAATGSVSVINDWDLSAARACSVVKYIDFRRVVDSDKYKAEGMAQYDPIASNDTEEGRSQNRRVELVLVRNDLQVEDTGVLRDVLQYDFGLNQGVTDPDDRAEQIGSNNDVVAQIKDKLNEKYPDADVSTDDIINNVGPDASGAIVSIPDSAFVVTEEGEESTEETEPADETTTAE